MTRTGVSYQSCLTREDFSLDRGSIVSLYLEWWNDRVSTYLNSRVSTYLNSPVGEKCLFLWLWVNSLYSPVVNSLYFPVVRHSTSPFYCSHPQSVLIKLRVETLKDQRTVVHLINYKDSESKEESLEIYRILTLLIDSIMYPITDHVTDRIFSVNQVPHTPSPSVWASPSNTSDYRTSDTVSLNSSLCLRYPLYVLREMTFIDRIH